MTAWQVAMLGWFVGYAFYVDKMAEAGGIQSAVASFGGSIGLTQIVVVWASGTVILGLFVLLTRRTNALVPND